jgi:hypothetical protein
MMNGDKDLGPRTKMFARRIIRLYAALFTTISKHSRGIE